MTPLEMLGRARADRDPLEQELLETLAQTWAKQPADTPVPLDVVAPFIRAAYGRGYTEGLHDRLR